MQGFDVLEFQHVNKGVACSARAGTYTEAVASIVAMPLYIIPLMS